MLKQRIITAVVLLAVLLPALFHPDPRLFTGLVLVLMGGAGWELARLSGVTGSGAVIVGGVTVVCCLLSWVWVWSPFGSGPWLAAALLWVLGGSWLLSGGAPRWGALARPVRVASGVAVLWLAWVAVAQARTVGVNFLLSILALVWTADICAYAAGRAFGRRKLAPAISPGKSWEGVAGGMVGVGVVAAAWIWGDARLHAGAPSVYTVLAERSVWLLVPALVFLTAMSVVGDLVESLIKRSAGVKDSSGLLPGHGGVLDRIDALLPTLPLAMMLSSL